MIIEGNEHLQLAKDLLCAFETKHHYNHTAVSDIQEGLYWDEEAKCYSADLGSLLRGETDEVRIYKVEDDWIDVPSRVVAYIVYEGSIYLFCLRF